MGAKQPFPSCTLFVAGLLCKKFSSLNMKRAQYEADLAAHQREEKLQKAKARNNRTLQETNWDMRMAWEAWCTEDERLALAESQRLFTDQRACKEGMKEELRQIALFNQAEVELRAEEVKAQTLALEVKKAADVLDTKRSLVLAAGKPKRKGSRSSRV